MKATTTSGVQEQTMSAGTQRCRAPAIRARVRAVSRRPGRWRRAALVAGVLASLGVGAATAAATPARATSAAGPVPGTIFVSNGGGWYPDGSSGHGPGTITVYRPGATGDARPEALITKGLHGGPTGVAFDAAGNLWAAVGIIRQGGNFAGWVVEYSRASLTQVSPAPIRTIDTGLAIGLTFDPLGDLWVATSTAIVEYPRTALAKASQPRPGISLASDGMPSFDRSGNLWAGSGDDFVAEYTSAALARSGSATRPTVEISSASLNVPAAPAFDRAGNLWVGNYSASTVVEFARADLGTSGSPAPRVIIDSSSFQEPNNIAFNAAGELWVPYRTNNTVAEFTPSQLARSGSPQPAHIIAGPDTELNWPWGIAVAP